MGTQAQTALRSEPFPRTLDTDSQAPKKPRGKGQSASRDGEAKAVCIVRQREARPNPDFVRLEALLDAAEADLAAPGLASLDQRSYAARIARRIRAYLGFAWSEPAVYRRMFRQPGRKITDQFTPRNIVERTADLIRDAGKNRELTRPVIGRIDSQQLALMQWVNLHGFADLVLNGILDDCLRAMEDRLVVHLLGAAGFVVAAYLSWITLEEQEVNALLAEQRSRRARETPRRPRQKHAKQRTCYSGSLTVGGALVFGI